ncbi:unnamed protein product, partial [Timema podura]|nr:unnamed protein product [Timema podura]
MPDLAQNRECQIYPRTAPVLDISGPDVGISGYIWPRSGLVLMLYNLALLTLGKMKKYWPQMHLDGLLNIWIVKPGASSRGRGIVLMSRPLLIHNTKFDIRQWFLVTCVQPLTIWMYKESYLRFCSQSFDLRNFHESVHLCNHAVQCKYKNGKRDKNLPDENMWDCYTFQTYLRVQGKADMWDKRIYPGMRQSIIGALLAAQETMDRRKNCFELFGADFMLDEHLTPWLIEINSCPAMCESTSVTARMCSQCLEDVIKGCEAWVCQEKHKSKDLGNLVEVGLNPRGNQVRCRRETGDLSGPKPTSLEQVVIDRRQNKKAETGMFEMVFRQRIPPAPAYLGMTLAVRGEKIYKTSVAKPANGVFRTNFMKQLREEDLEQIRIEPTPCRATAEFPSKSPLPDIAETKPAKRISTEDKGKYSEPNIFLDEDTVPVEIVKPIIQGLIENLKYKDDPNRFGETYDESPADTVQANLLNLFDGIKYNKDNVFENIFHTRDYGRNGKESLFEIEASIVTSCSDSESGNQNPNEEINCLEEGKVAESNATRTSDLLDHEFESNTKTLEAITKEGNTQDFDTELNRVTILTKDTQPIIQSQLENTSFKTNNLENESPENNTKNKNDETSKNEASDKSKSLEENETNHFEKQTESPKNIFEKQQNETKNKKISAITILNQQNENFKKSSINDPTKLIRKPKPNYIHKLENAKDLYKFITEKQNEIDSFDKQIECFQNMVEKKQSLTEQNEGKKWKINTKTIKLTNNKRNRSSSPAFLPSKPNKDDETRSTKPQNEENKRKLKRFHKKNGNNSEKRQNMKKQHKQIEAAKKQVSIRTNDEKFPRSLTFDPHRDSNNTIKHEMKINTYKNKDIKKSVMQQQNNNDQEIRPSFDHLSEPSVLRESYDELKNNDSKTNQNTIFSQEVFIEKHKTIESDCETNKGGSNKTSKPAELYKGDSNNPKYYSNHNLTSKELDGMSQTTPIETNIRGKVWLNPIDDQPKQLSSEETTPKRKKLKSNTWRNSDDAVRAIEFYDEWKKKLAQTRASCEELLYKLKVFKETDGLATKPKCSLDKNVIWDGEMCNKPTLSDIIKKLSQTQSGIEVCPSSSAKSLMESLSDSQTKNKMWERRTSYLNMAEEDIQTKSKHTNEKVGSTGQKIRGMPQLATNDKTIPPSKLMLPHIKHKSKTQLNNNIIDTQNS